MGWPDLVRKYVWDEEKTPYLVAAHRLTTRQARAELAAYAFMLTLLGAAVALIGASNSPRVGGLGSWTVAAYGLALMLASVALGAYASAWAARACATAPLALIAAAVAGVLRPEMTGLERVGLAVAGALWLAYGRRVVKVAGRARG